MDKTGKEDEVLIEASDDPGAGKEKAPKEETPSPVKEAAAPSPPADKAEKTPVPEIEKAVRKTPKEEPGRLRKFLEELRLFLEETEGGNTDKTARNQKEPNDLEKKLTGLEESVKRISSALGLEGGVSENGKKEKAASLPEVIQNLTKRLEVLEKAPGARTSLEGQESLVGEKRPKSVWKGLI